MRKMTLLGILSMSFGIVLVIFSASHFFGIILENEYAVSRSVLILGFVMAMGGGLIALSPFGRR